MAPNPNMQYNTPRKKGELITQLTNNMVTEITYQSRIGSEISERKSIYAGLLQGALLSPTLYNISKCSIPNITQHIHRRHTEKQYKFGNILYAESTAIIKHSRNQN